MSDHRGPDVTFIVAAQNVASFIEIAIRSALEQSNVAVEVIVVDDASSDDTAQIVDRMAQADPRVILLRHERAMGPGAARNTAMARATGTWLAILDGDDAILPWRSQFLIDLADLASVDLVADNFERITFDGKPTGITMRARTAVPYSFMVDVADFVGGNVPFGNTGFGAIKAMFRRQFIESHNVQHAEDVPIGEDYHFILSCLLAGAKFLVSTQAGYQYRQRPGSQSWRLTQHHVDLMLRSHRDTVAEIENCGAKAAASAAAYGRALERVSDMTRVVTLAKQGNWGPAFVETMRAPRSWALVGRMGREAVVNRLTPRH